MKKRQFGIKRLVKLYISYFTQWIYRYAESVGATHFHTSAKINRGLDESFVDIAQRMHLNVMFADYTLCLIGIGQKKKEKSSTPGGLTSAGSSKKLVIVDEAPPSVQRGGCC